MLSFASFVCETMTPSKLDNALISITEEVVGSLVNLGQVAQMKYTTRGGKGHRCVMLRHARNRQQCTISPTRTVEADLLPCACVVADMDK